MLHVAFKQFLASKYYHVYDAFMIIITEEVTQRDSYLLLELNSNANPNTAGPKSNPTNVSLMLLHVLSAFIATTSH